MDTYDEDHTQTTPEDAIEALMPGMSPAAVIEAMEDPGVFEQLSRGMLYEQMVTLRALAVNQSFPLSQRMELAKWLSKMGKVESPVQNLPTGAQLPMIQIVFPNAHRTTTISGTKQSHPVIDVISDD